MVEPDDTTTCPGLDHLTGLVGGPLPSGRDWVDQRSGLDLRVGATVTSGGIIGTAGGYDGAMSESANETSDQSDQSGEMPEVGTISDEQLPEDLQPKKNPLARNPDEEGDDEDASEPQVDGMPDMGQPGA